MTDTSSVPPVGVGTTTTHPVAVEFVPWAELRPEFLEEWKIGDGETEHLIAVGRTGTGKSSLLQDVVVGRLQTVAKSRAIIVANKPKDPTLSRFISRHRIRRVTKWKDVTYEDRTKRLIVLWPEYGTASTTVQKNKAIFREVLDEILKEGNWTILLDDLWYWMQKLNLGEVIDEYWNAARSSDVSVAAGSTRPVWISRSATSQHSWAVGFHIEDDEDRMRMGEVMGNRRQTLPVLDRLQGHDFLLKQTSTGLMYVSNLES